MPLRRRSDLVIAQLPIAEKENEITAIPKLLKLLNIQESLVTIDAVGTVQSVIDAINEKEADYLLTVKKGNPLTYQETKEMFAELGKENERITAHPDQTVTYEKQMDSYDVFKTIEKNRSRMEYRTMQICHNTDLITLENSLHYVLDDLTLIEKYAFRGIAHL